MHSREWTWDQSGVARGGKIISALLGMQMLKVNHVFDLIEFYVLFFIIE